MKKFENLSSFINSKGLLSANLSMPKLRIKEKKNDQDLEYVDYLLAKNCNILYNFQINYNNKDKEEKVNK